MFIGKYNKSVIVTYIGVIFGVLGTMFVMSNNLSYAMICLIFAGICDLFDGKVARMCKRTEEEKEFGIQIDSLADVFLFLGLPAFMGAKLFAEKKFLGVAIVLYVLGGIIRLAWFNLIADTEGPVKHYTGLPVTSAALILPLIHTLGLLFNFFNVYLWAAIYLSMAILFILNIKIPKPKGIWYAIFSIMAVAVTAIIIMWS
ncbi:MAG: CDP-alcohol phosphatidyltransferase family protein [Clostridia bacterium]|nr:CDP-alcohol phosphatidyltransferase family protein [Clostridia bacterium]